MKAKKPSPQGLNFQNLIQAAVQEQVDLLTSMVDEAMKVRTLINDTRAPEQMALLDDRIIKYTNAAASIQAQVVVASAQAIAVASMALSGKTMKNKQPVKTPVPEKTVRQTLTDKVAGKNGPPKSV